MLMQTDSIKANTAPLQNVALAREALERSLNALVLAGYLERVRQEPRGSIVKNYYRLVRDTGVDAPQIRNDGTPLIVGQRREALWRTLKIIQEFSVRELAIAASTEDCLVVESYAADYLHYLHQAGYLVKLRQEKGYPVRYRFLPQRNTGPHAPRMRRTRQVYDPNTRRVVWSTQEDTDGVAH